MSNSLIYNLEAEPEWKWSCSCGSNLQSGGASQCFSMVANRGAERKTESYTQVSRAKYYRGSNTSHAYQRVLICRPSVLEVLLLYDSEEEVGTVFSFNPLLSTKSICTCLLTWDIQLKKKKKGQHSVSAACLLPGCTAAECGRYEPFLPCCFKVLADRWMEFPWPPVWGNLRSGRDPSVLILATSSSAEAERRIRAGQSSVSGENFKVNSNQVIETSTIPLLIF